MKSLSSISLSKPKEEVTKRPNISRTNTHKDGTKKWVQGHNEEAKKVSKIQALIEVMKCELGRPGKASNAATEEEFGSTKEWTPLYYAAYHNRETALLHFLRAGQSPDGAAAGSEAPPLCVATACGHVAIVRILCNAGANINGKTKRSGETALHIAIKNERKDIIDVLLPHNPDISAKTAHTGDTPLHYAAAKSGCLAIVNTLLGRGASPDTLNTRGHSPAKIALQCQNLHAAVAIIGAARGDSRKLAKEKEELLKHVDNAQDRLSMNKEFVAGILEAGCPSKSTVLLESIKREYIGLVELFLERGTDPNYASREGILPIFAALKCATTPIIHALVAHKTNVRVRDPRGLTVLQTALDNPLLMDKEGFMSVFEALLSHGADAKVKYEDGSTLLHRTVGQDLGRAKVAQLLLQYGVDVNSQDRLGNTALHVATHSRSCISVLLKQGADVNITNSKGLTPLLYATRHSSKDKEPDLEPLVKASDLRKADTAGRTALHLASRNGLSNTVRALIQAGADTTTVDNKKRTSLLLAVLHHQWHIVPLLAVQPGINSWDEEGRTALHHITMSIPKPSAAWKDIASAVAPFCEKGVSRSMRDRSGATPLIQAIKSLPEEGMAVVEVLLSRKASERSNCVGHEDLGSRDALFYAATMGKPKFVAVLLQHGAPFTLKDWRPSKGRVDQNTDAGKEILKVMAEHEWIRRATALQRQSMSASDEPLLPKVLPVRDLKQLLAMGLDPDTLPKSHIKTTLLWVVLNQLSRRHSLPPEYLHDAVKVLFEHGANPNAILTRTLRRTSDTQNSQQPTSLTLHPLTSILEQCPDVDTNLITLFLSAGANHSLPSTFYDGRYPLHSAVQSTRLDIINLFLTHSPNQDHNLDLNPSDAKARTPLILASSNGHFDIVDVLLHSGAKIDAEDTEGNTALHSASAMGWKKIVSRLLRAGAKACETNNQGKTPRDLVPPTATNEGKITGLLKYAEDEERRSAVTTSTAEASKVQTHKMRQSSTTSSSSSEKEKQQRRKNIPPSIHISKPSFDVEPALATPVRFSKQMVRIHYTPPSPKRQSPTAASSPGEPSHQVQSQAQPPAQPQTQLQPRIDSGININTTTKSEVEKELPTLSRDKTTFDQKEEDERKSEGEELASWLSVSGMMDRL